MLAELLDGADGKLSTTLGAGDPIDSGSSFEQGAGLQALGSMQGNQKAYRQVARIGISLSPPTSPNHPGQPNQAPK